MWRRHVMTLHAALRRWRRGACAVRGWCWASMGRTCARVPKALGNTNLGSVTRQHRRASWHGQWREAKGFRFYLIDDERIVHLLSWHPVQNEEQLGAALQQVKEAGLIPRSSGTALGGL